MKQDTRLDSVARGHADWLLVNNYSGHFQVAGTPGFTGVSPADRAQTAGYPAMSITDENAGSTGGVGSIAGRGAHAVRSLLAAPYHLAGLVSGAREIGIAIRNDTLAGSTNGPRTVEQFNLSVPVGSSAQLPASDAVLTYPCEGTTGTAYRLAGESPNPIPGRDLSVSPIGHPVYVYARPSSTVVVTSASMIAASTGLPVTLRAPFSQVNDPAGIYSGNQVMVMPDAALSQSTSYQVNLAGTINGAPFTRTFTFLTGTTSAGG